MLKTNSMKSQRNNFYQHGTLYAPSAMQTIIRRIPIEEEDELSHKWVKRWEIESWAGKDPYIVSISVDGEWGCSCPQWKFRRIECKHIKEVKANENFKEGDIASLLKLTALRVEKLKAKGKTEKQIEKDLEDTLQMKFAETT